MAHTISRHFCASPSTREAFPSPHRQHRLSSIKHFAACQMTRCSAMADAATATAAPPSSSTESRVLIAYLPSQATSNCCSAEIQGSMFHLKHPKTGSNSCYMIIGEALQEIHWFKQPFSSWFLGNHVLEDGSLYMCTPVDPIFLLLPILDEARMKRGDDLGKFRSLEEILYVENYAGYNLLQPLLQNSMDAICEVRDVGNCKFYRLSDSKVLSWLCCKVRHTVEGLNSLKGYGGMPEGMKKVCAAGLLAEYLKEDPWLKMLCTYLSVDLPTSKRTQDMDSCEMLMLCESKASTVMKEAKLSKDKSKVLKKGSVVAGVRKVTQFFAVEQ